MEQYTKIVEFIKEMKIFVTYRIKGFFLFLKSGNYRFE